MDQPVREDAHRPAGDGIDVAMPEPPPADSAVMRLARHPLARHPKAIVTPHLPPHMALASIAAQQALAAGRPVNIAMPQIGEPLLPESLLAGQALH
ncbi:hypothetical protein K9U40_01770 [Xanthobacter autotrophicus]|uniref:hypothetical protein n=1 Tax=Xanthobacter TaxID=279 RepID=UPI0024AA5813|nr:hypothetical protein [Xanthobacter autotrophicus]MDI4663070.1 hypothetical protein [Xanthobacter autotrophicus]